MQHYILSVNKNAFLFVPSGQHKPVCLVSCTLLPSSGGIMQMYKIIEGNTYVKYIYFIVLLLDD